MSAVGQKDFLNPSQKNKMPKVVFTGVRAEHYEGLKAARRYIDKDAYAEAVAELRKAQAVADKKAKAAEERRIAREAAKAAAKEAKRVAAIAARAKKVRFTNLQKKFDAKQTITLKLKDLRKGGISDKDILSFIVKQKGMWSISMGDGQYYLLNDATRTRLLDLILKNLVVAEEFTESDGRLVQLIT